MVILVGGRFSLMQPLYTNMVAQARAEASDFTFLLIPLVVLAILAAIPLLLLSARGAGPGLGNQPGVLGGVLGPCPASLAVSVQDSGGGLYVDALNTPNGRLRWRMPLGGGEVSNMLLADYSVCCL
jgi:hypothetical protein